MKYLSSLILALLLGLSVQLHAQSDSPENLLLSGPMVGYTEMREALLWVQTNGPAQVFFEYSTGEGAKYRFRTPTYQTNSAEAYTARLIADQVKPGETYIYDLYINGQKVERPYATTFRTPPPLAIPF